MKEKQNEKDSPKNSD